MLYAPYFVLLITFVLSYFIMTSDTYKSLLQHYIEKEVKMQIKNRQSSIRNPAGDKRASLSNLGS